MDEREFLAEHFEEHRARFARRGAEMNIVADEELVSRLDLVILD